MEDTGVETKFDSVLHVIIDDGTFRSQPIYIWPFNLCLYRNQICTKFKLTGGSILGWHSNKLATLESGIEVGPMVINLAFFF